jgi:RHS repeat-associated protein
MRAFQGSEAAAPLYGFTARYRPDGLRAQKVNGLQLGANYTEENEVSGYYDIWATDKPTTRYYYEGQMPFGEDYTYSDTEVVHQRTTVYVPGLRGTDSVRVLLDGNETAIGWPIYDTHGNNVGMFEHDSDNQCEVGHERRYDAWGGIVWQTGDPPRQGYSANLGHRSDGESGLVYMRARYYEPWNGRFISEDPAMDGLNWFSYCRNDPVNAADPTGCYRVKGALMHGIWGFFSALGVDLMLTAWAFSAFKQTAATFACLVAAAECFVLAIGATTLQQEQQLFVGITSFLTIGSGGVALLAIAKGLEAGGKGVAGIVTFLVAAYSVLLLAYIVLGYEGVDLQ